MQYNYKLLLRKEPDGGYTVFVPALPGCITYGEDVDEAVTMAKEAIELYIEELKDRGEAIPDDSNLLECTVSVPVHGSKDLKKGTFLSILKHAGINKEEIE